MEGTLMEELRSLEDLLDLQAIDLEIDRLLDRRQSLPELAEYRAADEHVRGIDAEIETLAVRLREADLASDKADGELQMAEEKLKREESRLYAGGLSARDAEHLRQEVEMLRRHISEREDVILDLMDGKEQADEEMAALQEQRRSVQEDKDRLETAIGEAWAEIDSELSRQEERKAEIVPLVDPALLALYEQLRPTKEGVAVGRLAEGTCGGCHLRISAAEEAEVRRGSPPRCIHCRRILVPQ
jgi:predicted  nucleic acid-binding Zn-ribbon protein